MACSQQHNEHQQKTSAPKIEQKKTLYTCSMHPQVRQEEPGRCPFCGMDLIPVQEAPADSSHKKHESASESKGIVVHLTSAQNSVSSIRATAVRRSSMTRKIEFFGEIAPIQDNAVVYTWYYGGRVQKLLVDSNTTEVKKGEPLFEVFSEEALADQEAYLEILRERWLSTFYERDVLTARLNAVKSRLQHTGMSDADLEALTEDRKVMSDFVIRAPVNGSIVGGLPKVGERFEKDKMLFSISPIEKVWLIADVYEKDISALKVGQHAMIYSQANPEQAFHGKLVYLDRGVDPVKRSMKARFEVMNAGNKLLPMMSSVARVEMEENDALVIPLSAVIDTGMRKIVYVEIAPSAYEQREIQTSMEGNIEEDSERYVTVTSGLQENENVVVNGAFLIDAEAQLKGLGTSAHQH